MLAASTRRESQRYRYDDASRAGFVELVHDLVGPAQLRSLLLQVPFVCEVVLHRAGSKAAQGNASNGHAQQHNWQVMSVDLQLRGAKPLEFEVTTHNHVKPGALRGRRPTVTVCFRDPPRGAVAEAWRILWAAVGHLALFPREARSWMRDAAAKERLELGGVSMSGPPPPPAAPLPTTMPGPPPTPTVAQEETWHKYQHHTLDGSIQYWHSKEEDPTQWFLESAAKGWCKYADGIGSWWHHDTSRTWFRERNGAEPN